MRTSTNNLLTPNSNSKAVRGFKSYKDHHVQPLTSEFFSTLIRLETAVSTKIYTAEILDELTQYYAQAVGYYDSLKDNIAAYFMFKIQDILAAKKSLHLLRQEQVKHTQSVLEQSKEQRTSEARKKTSDRIEPISPGEQLSSTNNSGNSNANSPYIIKVQQASENDGIDVVHEHATEESSDDEDEDMFRMRRSTTMTTGRTESLTALKNKKQKLFSMQMKLQSEKEYEKQSLSKVLSAFGGSSQTNDQVVKSDIDVQRDRIRARMTKKKDKSLMNYSQSLSMAGFIVCKSENFGDKSMESFLKVLDDDENIGLEKSSIHILSQNVQSQNGLEQKQNVSTELLDLKEMILSQENSKIEDTEIRLKGLEGEVFHVESAQPEQQEIVINE